MAQKKTLSDALISTIKPSPSGGRVRVLDTRLPGFLVEVSPRHKRFVVRSRGHYKTLGRWPVITTQDARIAALEFLRELALGSPEKRDSILSAQPPVTTEWSGPTLREAIEEYVGVKRLKPRTATDYQLCLGRYWADYLERPLTALDGDAVLSRFRDIQSPAQANYSLRIIRAVFRFHNAAHDDSLPVPTAKVLALEGAHSIAPRSRLIPDDKQRSWYVTVQDKTGRIAQDLFIFLACTGLRLGEALSLTWGDVDLLGKSLTIKDTKNGRPHSLPLGDRMVALLEARHAPGEASSNVVFHINQRNVRKAVSRVIEVCPVPWSSHDLRRGFVSLAVRLNIPDRAVKRLVNHSERDVTGRHYVRQQTIATRFGVSRAAVAQWEAGTTRPDQGKLVRLAEILQVNLAELLAEDEDQEGHKLERGGRKKVQKPMDDKTADTAFRTWLKVELDRLHLSQAELARMSGVPQPTIQRIISGETGDPRWSTITKLREILCGQSATKDVGEGIVGASVEATEFGPLESCADIKQIRRANMLQLLEQEKSKAAFARKVGTDPAYVSQLLSVKTRAEIGDAFARNVEKAYELPHGWMDNVHAQSKSESSGMELIERIRPRLDHLGWSWGDLARAMGLTEQRVNNWRTRGVPARELRNVELALKLPRYALDIAGAQQTPEMAVDAAGMAALGTDESELLKVWGYLLPAEKEAIMKQIRPMAAHNKAVLEHYSKP